MKAPDWEQPDVFVSLGSNLGGRWASVRHAGIMLAALPLTIVTGRSSRRLTRAVGLTNQPDFVNQVLRLSTCLTPSRLMQELLRIELKMGRRRGVRWGPRQIDLDILFYGSLRQSTTLVTLPHPEVCNRPFFLDMIVEIAPDFLRRFRAENLAEEGQSRNEGCGDKGGGPAGDSARSG